jgi:hypothetical protein
MYIDICSVQLDVSVTCKFVSVNGSKDRLCGLVVRSGGPGSIPGTTRFSEKKKKRKGKQ